MGRQRSRGSVSQPETVWAEKEGVRFKSGLREFEGMFSFNGEMGAYVQYGVGK